MPAVSHSAVPPRVARATAVWAGLLGVLASGSVGTLWGVGTCALPSGLRPACPTCEPAMPLPGRAAADARMVPDSLGSRALWPWCEPGARAAGMRCLPARRVRPQPLADWVCGPQGTPIPTAPRFSVFWAAVLPILPSPTICSCACAAAQPSRERGAAEGVCACLFSPSTLAS